MFNCPCGLHCQVNLPGAYPQLATICAHLTSPRPPDAVCTAEYEAYINGEYQFATSSDAVGITLRCGGRCRLSPPPSLRCSWLPAARPVPLLGMQQQQYSGRCSASLGLVTAYQSTPACPVRLLQCPFLRLAAAVWPGPAQVHQGAAGQSQGQAVRLLWGPQQEANTAAGTAAAAGRAALRDGRPPFQNRGGSRLL